LSGPKPESQVARLAAAELVAEFEKVAAERVKPEALSAYRCVLKPFVTCLFQGGRLAT
jgi:hypothetical protein